jgi:uncharacterized protein YdhG (YjbR/CyaY superfamily)
MSSVIDEYISRFPEDVQAALQDVRRMIADSAPGAEEAMSYGIPTFRLNGNLVHFAAFKDHIGLYPTPSGIKEFKEELSEYRPAKGSVRFPLGRPLPLDLIGKIVIFRAKENKSK